MTETLRSRIPGSREFLEEDEEGFAPIDALLYWLDYGGFERCKFKYQGKWYVIHCDAWDDDKEYYFCPSGAGRDIPVMISESVLDILDAPLLPDGKTPRQVLSEVSFDEYQNI